SCTLASTISHLTLFLSRYCAHRDLHSFPTRRSSDLISLIARADLRDAVVQEGTERLYITKNWRGTGGVRLVLNPRAVVKAEYSHTGSYGGLPGIPDDVVTTSAVMSF